MHTSVAGTPAYAVVSAPVDLVIDDVVTVIELDRLGARQELSSVPGRSQVNAQQSQKGQR
jgi:hypothetical protein